MQETQTADEVSPQIIDAPGIRAEDIDDDAIKIIRRLRQNDEEAMLVGGCIRDLVRKGKRPKDFDIITSATPKQIRKMFRNSRIIGRRFRLVHVFWGSKIIEVTTYRAPDADAEDPRMSSGEEELFGDARSDVFLRDFTINALFYDPLDDQVTDYVGGFADLKNGLLRTIGDADTRIAEDPVRILRGIRYAASLDLEIEPETLRAFERHQDLAAATNASRLREEVWKFLLTPGTADAFELMMDIGLFEKLFPGLDEFVEPDGYLLSDLEEKEALPEDRLDHSLLWALLFLGVLDEIDDLGEGNLQGELRHVAARYEAFIEPLAVQHNVPRRNRYVSRHLLESIPKLLRGPGGRHSRIVRYDWFPQALDLYELYCRVRERPVAHLEAWQLARLETLEAGEQVEPRPRQRRRRRRRRGRPE